MHHPRPLIRPLTTALLCLSAASLCLAVSGCGAHAAAAHAAAPPASPASPASPTSAARRPITVVGAESQYANVLAQVGGRYVAVTAVMNNPNSDPHSFEASPSIASRIASAKLIIENGLGYDAFMDKLAAASPNRSRRLIDVQHLLRLPDSTANPHLWYAPGTMARVASAAASALGRIAPAHAAYFAAGARRFERSLVAVDRALSQFRRTHAHVPVATTEPVADYLLRAAGARNLTPWNLQADLMNGVDPAPQDLTAEHDLLQIGRVRAIVYNRQVTDPVTQEFLQLAAQHHVPEVAVYETMPAGYSYQSWMLAELGALTRAVSSGRSTTSLR